MTKVLIFEDDHQIAQMEKSFLSKQGFEVTWFDSYQAYETANYVIADEQPDVVLLDIELPEVNGYEICAKLKQHGLHEFTPIIFVSGLMNSEDIVTAYEVGGHDYLIKPLKLSELGAKLSQNIMAMEMQKEAASELQDSNKMSFDLMTSMSELGSILTFHDECMAITCPDELIDKLFNLLSSLKICSSVVLHGDFNLYRNYTGKNSQLEYQTIKLLAEKPRIYSWSNRTSFNYPFLTLLALNMPTDNDVRYGELKDLLCLILNGLDARLSAIDLMKKEQAKATLLSETATSLLNLTDQVSTRHSALALDFEQIMGKIEDNLSGDIVKFNLLEEEEKVLMGHVSDGLQNAQNVFDQSMQAEREFQQEITLLTNRINELG